MVTELSVTTRGQGLHEITAEVRGLVERSGVREGLCTLLLRHTSAGLIIQENADPSARHDLEAWLARHIPEGDPRYTHNDEGPDDMPSHIKSVLTGVCLSIPIASGALTLGRWQGVYLWEFRRSPHTRKVAVHIAADPQP
jgi:secondary thiamine-phosphate synthase enzyme